jgi:hypothetical protein
LAIYHFQHEADFAGERAERAIASAAYRADVCLTNERDGITYDFTRRDGDRAFRDRSAGGRSAEWALDRSAL